MLDFAIARYNPDGSLDFSFDGDGDGDGDGKVTTDFAGGNDQAHGVAIQADGKIVVAGVAFTSACPAIPSQPTTSPWPGTTPTEPSIPPSVWVGK